MAAGSNRPLQEFEVSSWSPLSKARAAGAFWLMNAVTGTLSLLWSGISALLIASVFYVGASLFVYMVLKPVNGRLSLLAAVFGIAGSVIGPLSSLYGLGLGGPEFIFFGLQCLLIGYLILRSIFLPRILGMLMVLSGLGWLILSSSNLLLSAETAGPLTPFVMGVGILGEIILTLWLLVVGVNEQRWMEQAAYPPG